MSLSLGSGPLGRSPAGAFNFDLDAAPAHRIYFADFLPRVRAVVDGRTVLDTTRGKLLYESGIHPRFYAPLEDFDAAVLTRTEHSTHCPFKGDASYWSVGVDGRGPRENAVWAYEAPIPEAAWLEGYASLYPDKVDEWWVEDERVRVLRDPFHRIDVLPSSRRVRITLGDDVVVDTDRAMLLFETGLPTVAYVPRADVGAAVEPNERETYCPYKGEARCWTVGGVEQAAWSYEYPRPECTGIAGYVAFDATKATVTLG